MTADETNSIINYAEAPRQGDWTLRSSLVRLAQPHPLRSEAVLQLVRRLDAALKPFVRELQKHPAETTRSIPGGASNIVGVGVVDLVETPDAVELSDAERDSLHLIGIALELDELANTLTAWAFAGSADPPVGEIDQTCARVLRSMNDLEVPEESQWEGPARKGRGV